MNREAAIYYPGEVPRHLTYPHVTLHGVLEESARRHPDATATIFYGATMTYGGLDREANRFAHALAGLGVEPGDRVAIHLPNSPQMLICLYGTLKAGALVTMLNPLYETRELVYQLEDAGARLMVTLSQREIFGKAAAAAAQAHLHHLIVTNIKDYFPPALRALFTMFKEKKDGHRADLDASRGQLWLKDLLRKQPAGSPQVTVDSAATAILQYTGGTTGLPKAAELTHDNLVANLTQARAWIFDLKEAGENIFMVLPLFHVYALTCCNLAVSLAAKVTLVPRFDLKEVLKAIEQHRPTVFPGIPAMYAAINHSLLCDDDGSKKTNISSIRVCVSGSDKLPGDVKQDFERLSGGKLVEGYGLTEAAPITHVNPIYGKNKIGSIGLPLPDTEVRIVDFRNGRDVEPGDVGEMLVRGPQVMKSYWHNPGETRKVLSDDGWLDTGDVARCDEDGFYYIVDRMKDVIITGGLNVFPREVEEVLGQFHKISEVAVKGIPGRIKGETIKAYVVLKDNEQATAGEIREFARQKLAAYKIPQQVEFRQELPRSFLRKVLKRKLDEAEPAE
ncbi:long-chain-fatty-acid--CoA ligase [bacterium BMS3Abin01]|nr:long-chain-fatty-acid--CoA ligase [bacterium BMS3Abin01]HDZ59230.1 long-chain fatty acid--CoA ligase [Actinomycetota bacterium]